MAIKRIRLIEDVSDMFDKNIDPDVLRDRMRQAARARDLAIEAAEEAEQTGNTALASRLRQDAEELQQIIDLTTQNSNILSNNTSSQQNGDSSATNDQGRSNSDSTIEDSELDDPADSEDDDLDEPDDSEDSDESEDDQIEGDEENSTSDVDDIEDLEDEDSDTEDSNSDNNDSSTTDDIETDNTTEDEDSEEEIVEDSEFSVPIEDSIFESAEEEEVIRYYVSNYIMGKIPTFKQKSSYLIYLVSTRSSCNSLIIASS